MTDINLATADRHQMKFYAKDELGLGLSLSMTEETMRARITAHCAQNDLALPVSDIGGTKGNREDRSKWPQVIIAKQEKKGGDEPAFVGFQGKGFLIPREIPCRVHPGIVEILRNAKQDIVTQDAETGEIYHNEVFTYPFQVIMPGAVAA